MSGTDASTSPATDQPEAGELELELTEAAVAKVIGVMDEQDLQSDERNLRLFVDGVGCGGPSFGLAFDKVEEGDVRIERHGLSVVVDPASAPYVHGSTIDFVETPEITGFKVTNPRLEAGAGCNSGGCGSSGSGPSECSAEEQATHGGHEHGGGGGCCSH